MTHLVLLGDSVFDNKAYVGSGRSVIEHLRAKLPSGWQTTLRAVDGDVTDDVAQQLSRLPADATHLFLSVGGNDALQQSHILVQPANSVAESLVKLSAAAAEFERHYRAMLHAVLTRRLPTAVCTIYNPRFSDPTHQRVAVAALCLFNDSIIRQATAAGIPIIDLRLFFTAYDDYANDIEPSVAGGEKIAGRIMQIVRHHDFRLTTCTIYD
jgi:lysophospholipase L1-like esterase